MPGDPTQTQPQSRLDDPPAHEEWYAVTGGGVSALRIAPGLTVGETEVGVLALNDPEPGSQWVEFVLSENGEPWVAIVTRDKSLRVSGVTHMRHRLEVGAAVQLPHNTLYISHDIRMPPPAGLVLEVVPREVPGRAQDLAGPGWEEALAAVREPVAAAPGGEYSAADEFSDPTELAEPIDVAEPAEAVETRMTPEPEAAGAFRRRPDAAPDAAVSVPGPRSNARSRRRSGVAHRGAVLLVSLGLGAITLAGVVAVFLTLRSGDSASPSDFEPPPGLLDEPAVTSGSERPLDLDSPPADSAGASVAGQLPARDPFQSAPPSAGTEDDLSVVDPAPLEQSESPAVSSPMRQEGNATATADRGSAIEPAPGAEPPPDFGEADTGPAGAEDQVAILPRVEPETEPPAATVDEAPATDEAELPTPAQAASPPDWRLVRAEELLEAGYVTFPPQDNAVAYLERLLATDPGNARALAMLDECSTRLIEAAVRAHDQGLEYEARNTLEEVLGFNPDNARANQLWREWVDAYR